MIRIFRYLFKIPNIILMKLSPAKYALKIGVNCNSKTVHIYGKVLWGTEPWIIKIGDNVHIAPGAIILGGCKIMDNSFVGSGTVVKQNTTISKNSILSSGNYFKK